MSLVKEAMLPGFYRKDGKTVEVKNSDVEQAYRMMGQLAENNLSVPIVMEHIENKAGQTEGIPMSPHELAADRLKRTVGYVDYTAPETKINSRGALDIAPIFSDPKVEKQVRDGVIKFVSPEIRRNWEDGLGNKYEGVPTHIALTHRPIQVDQEPGFKRKGGINTASRLETIALSDVSSFVLADDFEPEAKKETPVDKEPETSTNPDMPNVEDPANQLLESNLAFLSTMGITLPSTTDATTFASNLNTALIALSAAKDAAKQEENTHQEDDNQGVEEMQNRNITSFSDDSPHGLLYGRIETCVAKKQCTQSQANKTLVHLGSAQFSDVGEETGNGITTAMVEMFESNDSVQFSDSEPKNAIAARIEKNAKAGIISPGQRDQWLAAVDTLQFSDAGVEISDNDLTMTAMLEQAEKVPLQLSSLMESSTEQIHPGGRGFEHGKDEIGVDDDEASTAATVDLFNELGKEHNLAKA